MRGIETVNQVIIYCEHCSTDYVENFSTQKQAKSNARAEGWSIGKTIKCPECKNKTVGATK